MKLCLLMCMSFVPWSQGWSYSSSGRALNQSPQTQPQQPQTQPQQPQPQAPESLNCGHMERLREAHDRERVKIPRGDKFDDFDWHLSKELNTVERGNIVISPVSLKVVLAMLFEGARGTTAQEIGDALDIHNNTIDQRRHFRERFSTILQSLQTSPDDDHKIKMGTHAFIDQKVQVDPNYQCKLNTYYNSDIVKVDFSNPSSAIKVINNWAKNVTEGHIQDLISESEAQSSTIMLLLNAVYFKGQWEVPFPANQTKPGPFHLDGQKTVQVPFMNVTERFGYYDLPRIGAHMVELPYKGNKFSMYVLLPHNNTSLDAITKKLGPERSLSGIVNNMMPTHINLIMPKFEFDFTTKLRSTLEKLGIKTMFSPQAELTDITKTKSNGLVVSNVLQKAGISVTEAGTVAYAATAVDLVDKFGGSDETVDFVVNRPFLFFIEDTTLKTTVFVGKVTNPDNAKVVSTPQEVPAEKPTGGAEKPTVGAENHTGGAEKPTGGAEKPTGGAEKPTGGAEKPTGDTDSVSLEDRIDESGNKRPSSQLESIEQTSRARFNFFDGELLQEVSRGVQGNFVISPASVKTLLGLILEAADDLTLAEVKELLRLPNNSTQARQLMTSLQAVLQKKNTSEVEVDSETNAFLSKDLTFNTTYTNVISDWYKAGVTSVDFKSPENAANKINSWVRSQTRGRIPSLISPDMISPETMTVLVNTVYFDGRWKEEFQLKDTDEECFFSEPTLTCNKVPIMYKKEHMNYKFDKDFNSHVIQMPYKDVRFSMVLLVPLTVDGTRKIVRDINRLTFPALLDRMAVTEVHLKLPRFSVEYESDLTLTLTKMGLNTAFTDQAKLPFMINNKQGRISAVIHKAKIDVTEKGTKAAAASGASVVPLMSGNEAVLVTANHPFYYFVYEVESRSVLFSGRVSSLAGESANEQNFVGGGEAVSTPLAAGEYGKPSYARPASPQAYPGRPSASNANDVQFLGSNNQPYNIRVPPPPAQSRPAASGHDIEYPVDQGHGTGSNFHDEYRKRYSNNFRPQQRSSYRD